jgi:hypothetical protein
MGSAGEMEEFKLLVDVILEAADKFPQSPDTVTDLIQGLKTSDPVLRLKIVQIFRRGGTAALPPLIEALRSEDVELRRAAAATLGSIGPAARAAVPALKAALQDETVAPEAAEALKKITATLLTRQIDQFVAQGMPVFLVIAVMLVLVGLIYYVLRGAAPVVINMAVGFCLIGSSLGAILGGSRWGRSGAVVSALVLGLGGATMGAGIGYVAGFLLHPIVQSLHPQKTN